jgi:hypothetical protein
MTYDIYRPLANEHGEIHEEAAGRLEVELMERFAGAATRGLAPPSCLV